MVTEEKKGFSSKFDKEDNEIVNKAIIITIN